MAPAVATNELGAVNTTSPYPTPIAFKARIKASVPEFNPIQCLTPYFSWKLGD